MKNRIFSLLIALCLCVGLLPAVAYAAEVTEAAPQLPDALVQKLGTTTYEGSYYIYDLIGGTGLDDDEGAIDMQIAMRFTALDTAESAAANYYAEYTTDFFIEISGLATDEIVGNGCYLAGYYEAFGMWVKIPLDNFPIKNGAKYPVITAAGFDFDYTAICSDVQSFTCGIYFADEILTENPDLKVKLSLGLSETQDKALATEFITVNEYTYDVEDMKDVCEHKETVEVPAIEAACIKNGATAGVKCVACEKAVVEQVIVPAKGHSYDNDFDATCNGCDVTREVEEGLTVTADNKLQLADSNKTHTNHRATVYYLGDQTVEDIADEAALKVIDPDAKIYWGAAQINAKVLDESGNYVLVLSYNDSKLNGKKAVVYKAVSIVVPEMAAPEIVLDDHKLIATEGDASFKNYRAVVYYLGNQSVEDITDEAALKAIDPAAKTAWGMAEINKTQLLENGNYVVHLQYNAATGAKQTIAKAFTVDFSELTLNVVNGKLVAADPEKTYLYHRAVVYYLGDQTVEDIYDEAALKAIDTDAKTHWGLGTINKTMLTQSGNYVVMLHYNLPGSAKMTIAVEVTI